MDIREDTMFRPTMMLLAAMIVGSGMDYLFHIYMARALLPIQYSELAAIMSLLMILSLPLKTVSNIMTRFVTEYYAEGSEAKIAGLLKRTTLLTAVIGGLAALVIVFLTPIIERGLSLSSPYLVSMLAIGVFFKLMFGVYQGTIQALQMFGWFSAQQVITAFFKIITGIVAVTIGYGVGGAFLAAVLATVVSLILTAAPAARYFFIKAPSFDMGKVGVFVLPSMVAAVSYGLLTNVDLVAVRIFIEGEQAGLFAAASQMSKLIVFLPASVATVLFPQVTSALKMGDDPIPILKKALLSSLILCIIPTLAIAAFPDLVLTILYGEAYVGAADALVPLCFAMTFFGIGNLFLVFGLASDGHRFVAIIALFSILEIIVMGLFHNTIEQLALGILAVSALMCLFCSLYLLQNVKNGSGPYWASRNI